MTRKVLLTGAAGKSGSFFHNANADAYEFVLTDIAEPEDTKGAPFTQADLSDFYAIRPLFEGVDTVVHLGADPNMDASWESLLPNNVIATYNVFEAAHQAGCRRVLLECPGPRRRPWPLQWPPGGSAETGPTRGRTPRSDRMAA